MARWSYSHFIDGESRMYKPTDGISISSSLTSMMAVKTVRLPTVFFSLIILLSVLPAALGFSECGDYYDIGTDGTGVLQSPNYPNAYGLYERCIWIIKTADTNYRIRLTVSYTGETYNGTCSDYLEVRDGTGDANVLAQICDTAVNQEIISGSKYLWIMLKTDGFVGSATPMTATFAAVRNTSEPSASAKDPADCRSYEFECRNRVCVSMSYRCDTFNDCGCKDECDEHGCYDLDISKGVQAAISVSVGVFTFLIVCVLAFMIDGQHSWATSVTEAKRERETQEAARRKRVSRAFSKFIGGSESMGNVFYDTNTNFNTARSQVSKASKASTSTTISKTSKSLRPPPVVLSSVPNAPINSKQPASKPMQLKGQLSTLTVPPRDLPTFRVTDMTVTDIDA